MSTKKVSWGRDIAPEIINGITYRMYTERPRRVETLISYAKRWGARPYIIQGERLLSFEDFHHSAISKARHITDLGICRGDRTLLLGWNSPEWVLNFWATILAGAVPVLANAWWSEVEVRNAVVALQPAMILADSRSAARVPEGARQGPWSIDTTMDSGSNGIVEENDSSGEEDTGLIIFTSGTSGQPKAVVLSHRALLARLQMTLHITRRLPHQIDESAHDVTLITGPLFHVGGMQTLLRAVIVGDTLVLSEGRYDPAEVLAAIERNKVKRWNAVPTMVSRLLDHPDVSRRDLSSLKSISIGGAPVHAELMRRIRTQLPSVSPRIPTGYGLTENGGQATAAAGSEAIEELGSAGKPLPCVEIRFREHPDLPDGEVLLRSPTQMSGFYGLDEPPIDSDGWLHTGDLGRLDDKGNLWITGRCKDMIIRGGENIAPAAIERALLNIPGVIEAVVFGVPHPDLGEEVMAVVVTENDFTANHFQEQLRGQIASFAVPSRWRLQREPLPTNHTGKVDKTAISARARAELQSEK